MTPEQIKSLRAQLGITQRELAERINALEPGLRVAHTSVSRWESGRVRPAWIARQALIDLARLSGMDLEQPPAE
jgi:transcriptional regulator with XRE-family HTH domain